MRRFIAIAFLLATSQAWAAFGYYSPVSINAAQVPSTQTDFPVLVSVTDNRFKTVGNGGHVQNSSGFDIRPYTDSTLTTAITGYELERYNASTGEVIMWVKASSLSSSTTPFVLAYGDSGISTDGSSTTTWSNGFLQGYHLADGSTLSTADMLGVNNGTNVSGATAVAGKIDGGVNVARASHQYIAFSAIATVVTTLSVWANATTLTDSSAYNSPLGWNSANSNYARIFVKNNGKMRMDTNTSNSYDGTGTAVITTGTWNYFVMTYSNANGLKGYVNGVLDGTSASGGALTASSAIQAAMGRDRQSGVLEWDGKIDEGRIASVERSADWISTEYNNQSAPGTFETLGTEVAVGVTSSGWFYFFP